MRKEIIIFSFLLLASSCHKSSFDSKKTPVMEVNGEVLYQEDIEKILPEKLSDTDSIAFVENYKKKWAINVLLFEKADENIKSSEKIDKLTEEYRKELIINEYQQGLINQNLKNISQEESQDVYEKEKENFILDEPIIKGIYIKLPSNAPNQEQLAKWLTEINDVSLEHIEKYCIKYASSYNIFMDSWTLFYKIDKLLPQHMDSNDPMLTRGFITQKDSSYRYFLRITGKCSPGTVEPYEIAQQKIANILAHREKTHFINEFQDNLYNNALKKKKITFLKKN